MRRKSRAPLRSKLRRCTDAPPDSNKVSDSSGLMRHLTLWRHSQNLLRFLDEDRSLQKFCDVSISVGGTIYRAHKVVLAYGSSYFHAELSKNPAMTHVTLDHVEGPVFQHLLDFLYTSECGVTDTAFPALIEAARFLDMMDILKMLCKKGEVHPPTVAQTGTRASPPAEMTSTLSPAGETHIQSPPEQSNQAISENAVSNHLTESHRDLLDGTSTNRGRAAGQRAPLTRRSARTRRTPAKYKGEDVDFFVNTPEEKQKNSPPSEQKQTRVEVEEVDMENQTSEPDSTDMSKPAPGDDREDEEDEGEDGGDVSEDVAVQRTTTDVCAMDKSQQGPTAERTGGQGVEGQGPEAGSSNKSPVYPEGLAPVIVPSSSKKILMCPKCDKTFDRAAKYVSHTRVHTGEKPFQCDICFQRYSTKSNLTVHRKKHAGDAPFKKKEHKCPFCNKLHASRKTLAKHVRRFHPDNIQEFLTKRKKKSEGWKCAICLKTFTRRPHLQEHMILHTQDRPFKCTFCDEYFKSRFARLKHQEKYHLGPFPCEICGRQFNDTGNRKRHMECTHGGKRKWTCFICGKSVRERTTLKEHMRIHSGEKPHLCSICGQNFRHGSSYRLHLRVHHDDKRYECDECGKTFIRHDHLTKHQKIHSGEKAHQCEECGKCFRRHDHLSVHYRSVHLGEKIWQKYKTAVHQCEVCKKEFKGKSSLEMHFRTHSGEKPHKCPECHLTFRIKKTLTKHMVIHSDARPFNCAHCSATFKRKDKLKYHVDHVHSARASCVSALGQDKMASIAFEEASKTYHAEPKSAHQSPPPPAPPPPPPAMEVSVSSVPLQMSAGAQGEVNGAGASSLSSQAHSVANMQAQGQQQNSDYQATTDLAFLEKYTLTPQPANIAHPVRPDQMLDPRDQSYLGTFLGLDSSSPVQNSEHNH